MSSSPEPWKLSFDDGGPEGPALRDSQGHIVADIWGAENGRRIVACVNALVGMPIEKIEEMAQLRQQGTPFMIHRAADMAKVDMTLAGVGMAISKLQAALQRAESFIAGFEGDESQEGIDALLTEIRMAIEEAAP
jgi:hypothetical protein